ncbi:MAG: hypothetical protein JNM10_12210 [Planctomycetia bacterium]|nr:hypothetical protein [Planctomycetia bacterium]
MRKPFLVAAACSTLALSGCVSQRAEAVARAQTVPAGAEVTSTRLVAGGSSARLSTPGVAAKAPVGKPINATCPVMLGNPVDPKVTAEWKGAMIAFCDVNARSTWTADPARYAGNLPRISGSGGDGVLAPPVARRRTPSAARVVAAIPKAPPVGAIGSPDGSSSAAPVAQPIAAPAAFAMGSPDGAPLALPKTVAPVARPAAPAVVVAPSAPKPATVKPPATKLAPIGPVKAPIAPAAVPPLGDGHEEDCEDCPGGVCRVPGM